MKMYIDGKISFNDNVSQKTISAYCNDAPIYFDYILFKASEKDFVRLDISMSYDSIENISKKTIIFSVKLEERSSKNKYFHNNVKIDEPTFVKTICNMTALEVEVGLTIGTPTIPVENVKDFFVKIDAIDVGGRVFRPRNVVLN